MADPDARRRAEEALRYDHDHANSPEVRRRLRGAVEALLAAGPEAKTPPVPITPPPCGGRCEDALDSRSPCPSCAERLAPPPAPEAPILPVCLECSFASGGHVHVNREDGSQAVRYPTAEEWNAAIRQAPPSDAVREAAEVVRTILTAHDARLSESGVLTYGPPSKGTGFVAAIQWLRRYDAARGGE